MSNSTRPLRPATAFGVASLVAPPGWAERLFALFENAALIGIVNWVMMGGVESIWDGLCDEVFPKLGGAAKKKRVFLTPAPIDPVTGRPDPGKLNAHQAALRQAVVDAFNAKKARSFLQKHVHHVSVNRELSEGIRFLFDEAGKAAMAQAARSIMRFKTTPICGVSTFFKISATTPSKGTVINLTRWLSLYFSHK